MGAYNWIEFEGICPLCDEKSILRAQTHVASDFDGDERGRFCHRTFRIGDRMFWWEESDQRYKAWKDSNWLDVQTIAEEYSRDASTECCYTDCTSCGSEELYAVVCFQSLIVTGVLQVGLDSERPEGFER